MKRSLRLPFSVLVLIAVFTVLTCRAALRRGLAGGPFPNAGLIAPPLNETLLQLASANPAEAELSKDVDDLLDGNLPAAASSGPGRFRSHSAAMWRHENHLRPFEGRLSRHPMRLPIRLRAPKDYRVFPEFRRSLRDWFRRRRFQPGIMSEMLALVKKPIDLHHGRPETGRPYSCAVVIEGYNRNVGSKTDLSFVNSNILHLCARREGCFCHPYGEAVPIIMYICQAVHFLDYTLCNSSHKAPLVITDPRFDLLCARIVKYYSLKRFVEETGKPPEDWSKAHDERMFHYSSGMQAIMLALGICDQVSVFGFGKSADAKHHYHTNQKGELDLHDYEAEYAFYRDLVERPQVIPFLKDSGFKVPPVVFYY